MTRDTCPNCGHAWTYHGTYSGTIRPRCLHYIGEGAVRCRCETAFPGRAKIKP